MTKGWTGGQYSLFRVVFGTYLTIHFAQLIPWGAETFSNAGVLADASASPLFHAFPSLLILSDAPWMVGVLLVSATAAALLFALGRFDRIAAVWMWYVLACLFTRNPLTANPSLPFVGWMLLAHACLPGAPYGSLAAKGRSDPDKGWRLSPYIFAAAWIVLALAYSYSGYTKLLSPSWRDGTALADVLQNPLARDTAIRHLALSMPAWLLAIGTWGGLVLELGFAPLALFRRTRPWVWLAMLGMHGSLIVLIDFADLSLGMVMIHLFTFDPAWVRGTRTAGTERTLLFYDGHCGLCHRAVRFVLAEDRDAEIALAPLQSEALRNTLSEAERKQLPDSIVLRSPDGRIHIESQAIIMLMLMLGGYWRVLGTALRLVPRTLRDAAYRGIARVRHRLFAKPDDACPLMPEAYRSRFLK